MIRILTKNRYYTPQLTLDLYLLRHFKHPSIVRFYDSYNVNDDIWVDIRIVCFNN